MPDHLFLIDEFKFWISIHCLNHFERGKFLLLLLCLSSSVLARILSFSFSLAHSNSQSSVFAQILGRQGLLSGFRVPNRED
jgi:hypothetical protein